MSAPPPSRDGWCLCGCGLRVAICDALDVLGFRGWGAAEEWDRSDPDDAALIEALERIRVEAPHPGDGQWIADEFERLAQVEWERTRPRWQCPCGRVYAVEPGSKPDRPYVYALNDDGTFGDLVAGYPLTYNKAPGRCGCGRDIHKTLADPELAAGQAALF